MSLFNWGDFPLSSGARSPFKIDCEALMPADWVALGHLAMEALPAFSRVEGVPWGGLPLATMLSSYAGRAGPVLLVDDVFTTGRQITELKGNRPAIGLVVFARNPTPDWIRALFVLTTDIR